jgi:hypothetical protein
LGSTFCGPATSCNVQVGGGGVSISPSATELVILDGSGAIGDVTLPCAGGGIQTYTSLRKPVATYDDTDNRSCIWSFELSDNLIGTTISVQYVWSTGSLVTTTNDDVCMVVDAVSIGEGEDFEGTLTFGTAVGQQDTGGGAEDGFRLLSPTFTVTPAGMDAGEQLVVRMLRDTDASSSECADDNISGEVDILAIRVSYEVDNVFSGE